MSDIYWYLVMSGISGEKFTFPCTSTWAELGTHNFFAHVSVNPIFFMELWKKLHDYVAEHVIVHENVNKQLHEPVHCAWTVRWWSFHNAHMYSCSANSGIGSIAWSTWSVFGPFFTYSSPGPIIRLYYFICRVLTVRAAAPSPPSVRTFR